MCKVKRYSMGVSPLLSEKIRNYLHRETVRLCACVGSGSSSENSAVFFLLQIIVLHRKSGVRVRLEVTDPDFFRCQPWA